MKPYNFKCTFWAFVIHTCISLQTERIEMETFTHSSNCFLWKSAQFLFPLSYFFVGLYSESVTEIEIKLMILHFLFVAVVDLPVSYPSSRNCFLFDIKARNFRCFLIVMLRFTWNYSFRVFFLTIFREKYTLVGTKRLENAYSLLFLLRPDSTFLTKYRTFSQKLFIHFVLFRFPPLLGDN